MVERKGSRKKEWDNMVTLPSHNIRAQYIIDRYLKKTKLPKYKNKGTKEEDSEDFKEIVELEYFTVGDLAKYYTLVKGKVPPSLDSDLEIILYNFKQKQQKLLEKEPSQTFETKITKKTKTTTSKKAKSSNFAEAEEEEEELKKKKQFWI